MLIFFKYYLRINNGQIIFLAKEETFLVSKKIFFLSPFVANFPKQSRMHQVKVVLSREGKFVCFTLCNFSSFVRRDESEVH